MSETRKNHHNIDGGQVKEDDHIVASYKPIPESDAGFRTSKSSLTKSKEKVDEAEERLLNDLGEKIVCVDMADAKYVVGDHRNGDAKIELDANKRQYSGLTKEELLKYADDPFWVRLRWFMFVLFWALWLAMLAGAIAIIIRAPKCSPPPPKKWFEKGPLVDLTSLDSLSEIEEKLPLLQSNKVQGVFVNAVPTYDVLESNTLAEDIRQFIDKAKSFGVKVIVDLTPNFVSNTSSWFQQSANRSAEYEDYFTWVKRSEYVAGNATPPNNWVSTLNEQAWSLHPTRNEWYLHQFRADQPDLNFRNPAVSKRFDDVLRTYVKAGVDGVRLVHARHLLVNSSLPNEEKEGAHHALGATHDSYAFWRHQHTRDLRELDGLLARWADIVNPDPTAERVFTLLETSRPELFLLEHNVTSLTPASAAPIEILPHGADTAAEHINRYLDDTWNALQLKADPEVELAEFALLLPAAPVIDLAQLKEEDNTTTAGQLSHLVPLREDASIQHGHSIVTAVNSTSGVKLLLVARWKAGHTGYLAVLNPSAEPAETSLAVTSVPAALSLHHVTAGAAAANYTNHMSVDRSSVLVPAKSSVILSYVPEHHEEE